MSSAAAAAVAYPTPLMMTLKVIAETKNDYLKIQLSTKDNRHPKWKAMLTALGTSKKTAAEFWGKVLSNCKTAHALSEFVRGPQVFVAVDDSPVLGYVRDVYWLGAPPNADARKYLRNMIEERRVAVLQYEKVQPKSTQWSITLAAVGGNGIKGGSSGWTQAAVDDAANALRAAVLSL